MIKDSSVIEKREGETMANLSLPKYREEKAIAVATRLLSLSGGKCDKYWLNKLMYYVERESLVETGQPIFFDAMFSIPYGPIVSSVKDGIDATEVKPESSWSDFLKVSGKRVVLRSPGDYSLLSDFEDKIIFEAFRKFRGWTFDELRDYFHKLPEFVDTTSSIQIDYREILKLSGIDNTSIEDAIENLSYISMLESKLNCV